MFFKKKKPLCEHDWHELEVREEIVYEHFGGYIDSERYDFAYIYCPICDTRKRLHSKEWSLLKKEQEIRSDYFKK